MKKKTRNLIFVLMTGLSFFMVFSPVGAEEFNLLGRPGHVFGYVTQEASYGINNDYNTQYGLNAALMNVFIEGDYQITDNLRFYGAGLLTVDWIYQLLGSQKDWEEKEFDKSDGFLNVDDEYWQLLNEAHFTWTTDYSLLRVGKQVVSWGEIMGPAIVSQWNPQDQRRGLTSVELETSTIPIWLIRFDYFVPVQLTWLTDLNLQFVFNPNADFIPNQGGQTFTGNKKAGIWAPKIEIPLAPGLTGRIGKPLAIGIDERDEWSEGHEFGFRVKGVTSGGQILSLMGFYGYNNSPVVQQTAASVSISPTGHVLLHPAYTGFYPLQRFVAGSFATDLEFLRTSFTGGVAPSIYCEAMYEYQNTFDTSSPGGPLTYDTSDEVKAVLEIDYKVKIPALNPTTYFTLMAQLNYDRILDEDVGNSTGVKARFLGHQDSYTTLLLVTTSYFHNKLTPSFSWVRDARSQTDIFGGSFSYAPNTSWTYTLAGQFFNTRRVNEGFYIFDEKDLIYFKIAYKWG